MQHLQLKTFMVLMTCWISRSTGSKRINICMMSKIQGWVFWKVHRREKADAHYNVRGTTYSQYQEAVLFLKNLIKSCWSRISKLNCWILLKLFKSSHHVEASTVPSYNYAGCKYTNTIFWCSNRSASMTPVDLNVWNQHKMYKIIIKSMYNFTKSQNSLFTCH